MSAEEQDTSRTASTGASSPTPETSPDRGPIVYVLYWQRWFILTVFSVMACLQCLVWNTYGPIDEAMNYAYGWSDSTVAFMANWGTIMFVVSVVPLSLMLEKRGLRETTILVAFLIAIGTVLRSVSRNKTYFLVTSHICSILNGICGVTVMAAPPAISAVWFSPTERTTATSINQVFNNLGNAVSFVLGPYLVPGDNYPNTTATYFLRGNDGGNTTTWSREDIRERIQWYLIGQAVFACALLVLILAYFPAKPLTPPSPSGFVQRADYLPGIKALATNRNVWLCTFAYSMAAGISGAWTAVLVVNFKPLGVNDKTGGFIGLLAILTGAVVSVFFGYITDRIRKHIKVTLVSLLTIATLFNLWTLLLAAEVIPFSEWQLYTSVISSQSFGFACSPLFFEYTVEIAYPVSENLVASMLTAGMNLIGFLFLCVFFFNIGTTVWMNYLLVASTFVAIPAVLFTTENYLRSTVDEGGGDDGDVQNLLRGEQDIAVDA